MTRPAADGVVVQWTGTGTGTVSLSSAVIGWQGFPAALSGMPISYSIENLDSPTPERETGLGTYTSSGNTLSRDLVSFSTTHTIPATKQNFTAGNKVVRFGPLTHDVIENRATVDPGINDDITAGYIAGRARWLNTATNELFFCRAHGAGAAIWRKLTDIAANNGGTFAPGSVDLSGTRTYVPYSQTGEVAFALAAVTEVNGAWVSVLFTGTGDAITYSADFAAVDGSSLTGAPYSGFVGTRRLMIMWDTPTAKALVALSGTASGGGGTWGSITGTLSSQTDLQAALNAKQAVDPLLTAIAGLTTVADRSLYFTGSDAPALTPLTAFARTLLDDVDAATARLTLGAAPSAPFVVIAAGDLTAGAYALTTSHNGATLYFTTAATLTWGNLGNFRCDIIAAVGDVVVDGQGATNKTIADETAATLMQVNNTQQVFQSAPRTVVGAF